MNIRKQFIHGFTIVELLIVIVVIGILATIVTVSYVGIQNNAIGVSLQSDLSNASDFLRIDQAHSGTGSFPTSLAAGNGGKGIPASSGTSYPSYIFNNSTLPHTFCLTATKSSQSYFVTQDGTPMPGVCPIFYLDAGVSTSYPGTGNAWNDLSGNGYNGVINGGVTYSSNTNGGVMSFNGVSQDNVTVSGLSQSITTNFTAEVWVNSRNTSVDQTVMSRNGPFFIRISSSRFRVGIYTGSWLLTNGSIALSNNTWYDLVLTYDGMTVKSYVNGVQDLNIAKTGNMTTLDSLTIGYPAAGGEQYVMNGLVGVARIYNVSLSSSQVSQNYKAFRGRYGL